MARKVLVPEIPPVPSGRAPRAAIGSRLPARTVLPKQIRQPELPDLMEAFWGDGARADPASGTRPGRDRRRPSSDPG